MIDNDARPTDLHPFMQRSVTPDPRLAPTTRCPRCARDVDPADLSVQALGELRLLDPHCARYDRQPFSAREGVALCDACERQLDAIAQEMDTQRRRLARLWPLPTSPRERLMDDQCLSRTFEEIRDLHIERVLGWAIWYDQRGQDACLVVYETGEWAVHAVPRGQVYDYRDDRGSLSMPIPVAPPTSDASSKADAASSKADAASSKADAASSKADAASSKADAASSKADAASSKADAASSKADAASSDNGDASSDNGDASSKADAASSDNGDASSEDDSDAAATLAGSTLRAFDAAAFVRRHAPSDADREPLERDRATRFYQTLYRPEGHQL